MASVINTNVMSLNAQRNLNQSHNALKTSLERLSSGLRINSAKDDAAGLAIADRMTSQIRGMNQAARNANDAISLAQTGEGALKQVTSNLQRMRELAVQSANVTNTDSDRESLNAEYQELLAENDRLAQTTSFNGRKVLDGSMENAQFQVGANVGETITVNVSTSMRTDSIGNFATRDLSLIDTTGAAASETAADLLFGATGSAGNALLDADGDLQINGVDVLTVTEPNPPAGQTQDSAYNIAAAINAGTADHGVTAEATAAEVRITNTQLQAGLNFTDNGTTTDTLSYTVKINDVEVLSQDEGDARMSASQLASAINSESSTTGVTARLDSSGNMTLSAADGRNIKLEETLGGATATDADTVVGYFNNTMTEGGAEHEINVSKGGVTLTSDSTISLTSNDASSDAFFTDVANGATDNTSASTIDSSNILTVSASETAIHKIDQSISDVDVFRGTFGALQARFESTVASLQTTVENVSAARSRIQDTDFAAETAELTRTQILQQAGTAMLAQANSSPQSILSLLQ